MPAAAMFSSWKDCYWWFAKARSPEKGRPIKQGWRMFKGDDDTYFITAHSHRVCTFNPDNTVTFDLTAQSHACICHTISSTLSSVIPYLICRVGTGRYVVNHVGVAVTVPSGSKWYTAFTKQAYDLFPGITFDNTSMICVNPQPKATRETENTEKRRVWLQTLRRFKRGLSVRAKLGVFTALNAAMKNEQFGTGALPMDTNSDAFVEFLYRCMRDDVYPDELLRSIGFIRYATWRPSSTGIDAVAIALSSSILQAQSFRLRRHFGLWESGVDIDEL